MQPEALKKVGVPVELHLPHGRPRVRAAPDEGRDHALARARADLAANDRRE
jgi:hypothetical protein